MLSWLFSCGAGARQAARVPRWPRQTRPGPALQVEALETRLVPSLPDNNNVIADALSLGNLAQVRRVTNFAVNDFNDVDMFSFEASANQEAIFAINRPPGDQNLDSYLRLFDSHGVELANSVNQGPGGQDAALAFQLVQAGTYYLGVSAQGNAGYDPVTGNGASPGATVGTYVLTMSSPGALDQTNPANPDGQIGTALVLGNARRTLQLPDQALTDPAGVLMYRFTVSAGQFVAFALDTPRGSHFDPLLRLFDAGGSQLAFNDDGPRPGKGFSLNPYFEYRFAQGGTYYLGVSSYPNYTYDPISGFGVVPGSTGGFTLTLAPHSLALDNNNLLRNAISLGAATQVRRLSNYTINPSTDVDMFRFTAAAGQRVTLAVTPAAHSELAPYLRLFDAAGRELAHSAGRTLTYRFAVRGTYYLGVSGQGNTSYNPLAGGQEELSTTEGNYNVTLTPSGSGTPGDLLPAAPSGQIAGIVYYDQNGDGQRQATEVGEPSHIVLVALNGRGALGDGAPSADSVSGGRFRLTGLQRGRYAVFALPASQFGFQLEKAGAPHVVQLARGQRVAGVSLGLAHYLC